MAEPRRECPVPRPRPRADVEQRRGTHRAAGRRAVRAEGRHGAGDASAAAVLKATMRGSGALSSASPRAQPPLPDAVEEQGERPSHRERERGAVGTVSLSDGPDAGGDWRERARERNESKH